MPNARKVRRWTLTRHDVPAAIAFKLGRVEHEGKRWRLRTKQAVRAFGMAPHAGAERDYLPVRGAV